MEREPQPPTGKSPNRPFPWKVGPDGTKYLPAEEWIQLVDDELEAEKNKPRISFRADRNKRKEILGEVEIKIV